MSKNTGVSGVLNNMRKKLPVEGVLNQSESLSSMMSNLSLETFIEPRDGVAIAAFKVATTNPSVNTITAGIQKLFKGELNVVEGSVKVQSKGKFFTSVSAHLVRNTVVRAVGDSIPQGFISLSRNIFMEERDSKTWKLITNSEGKQILVRDNNVETDADMEKLLSSLSSANHQYTAEAKSLVATASAMMQGLGIGVLVSYVTESSQELGFVVQDMDNQGCYGVANASGFTSVSANRIVHTFDLEQYYGELSLPKAEAVAGTVDINVMVDYYKKVFGHNKDFMDRMLNMVKNNAMV
jgi:hypothetical protein